ncbi:ATP-binding protein [Desulfopila aestuarii]|uniref:histidine kinase n=1 Tax=Desulfopila aestuarii DSM 18488 TaxID=1121416 RepID=A0A1M7YAX5_9BACT|nr:ATP-binding protein [Desulfopila aestuarii]SHO49763.1 PAS domain S-box-containing protein [Desulfopila aestuarii DSM 18488]
MPIHNSITRSAARSTLLRQVLLLLLLFAVIFIMAGQTFAQSRHILYLNSYHVGYKWSDEEYQGFLDTLEPSSAKIALHVEYLDTKRFSSDERLDQLAEALAIKYQDIPIDMVVSTDDAAFLLLKRFGNTVFPGVPVFFCGTNYLDAEDLHDLPNFHGVTERADIDATFATILELLPQTLNIYVINDRTITGKRVHPAIEKAMAKFQGQVKFTLWEDISMAELISRVNSIPQDSVIFYTFFFQDKTGQTFEYDQAISLISRQSPVPIFGAWDFNLGLGLTGGMLTSGYQQGAAMAEMVRSWLERTPITEIPPLAESPNRFMFDYAQLTRFNINPDKLPPDSLIINRPITFIQKHQSVLITSGIFIAILLVVILILTVNIYRRRQAEIELRRSEENFRSIFNNNNDGLYQATADGRFLQVNPALAKMLKFSSPQEVIDHFTDIDQQLYISQSPRKTLTNNWAKGEHSLKCRDGSIIDVIENTHTVYDLYDNVLYLEGSITDISEYKKTQELISQTEKIISLGGVAAGIAHEIRSPLASIVQGIQVVKNRIFDNNEMNIQAAVDCNCTLDQVRRYAEKREIKKMLGDIHEAGQRAGVIIEDMLSFSRKTIGDFSLESLEKIINQAIALAEKDHELKRTYSFKSITINKLFEENMPKVYCSASKIQQVFFNILKNGAEAMGDAGTSFPTFTIRIMRDGKTARVEIEDNGPGMSSELAQRVFDPFFTTKEREKGTGLGLSVSYFIVKENHHGDLRVSTQPDLGTTFIVELPLEPPLREQQEAKEEEKTTKISH